MTRRARWNWLTALIALGLWTVWGVLPASAALPDAEQAPRPGWNPRDGGPPPPPDHGEGGDEEEILIRARPGGPGDSGGLWLDGSPERTERFAAWLDHVLASLGLRL